MIGQLPEALTINGIEYPINTDFRVALTIFEAAEDPELTETEQADVMLYCLYCDADVIPECDCDEACSVAAWFLDGGIDSKESKKESKQVISWTQDEQVMFAALNKVAGFETRETKHLHWWTFLSYFSELEDGLYNTILSIRQKKARNKPLDPAEKEFYTRNKDIIDIQNRYSTEQKNEMDRLNALLDG